MEIIYQYDGTFDGFLCCVFHSYVEKELPVAIYCDEEFFSLYEVRNINTVPENAGRVYRSIVKRSQKAADVVRRAFFHLSAGKGNASFDPRTHALRPRACLSIQSRRSRLPRRV